MSFAAGHAHNLGRSLVQVGRCRACWLAVLLVVTIHLVITAIGAVVRLDGLYMTFGLSREGFFGGRVWQLASHSLLHGSWVHLGLNGLFVLLIGSRIESVTGERVFWRTLVAGTIGGGLLHLALGSGLLVGLSGGCMALLLLLTTLSPESRMLPVPISARSLGWGVMIAETILALLDPKLGMPILSSGGQWLVSNGFGSWFQIGHACHVGGGIAGFFMAKWVLRPRVSLADLRRERARREAG